MFLRNRPHLSAWSRKPANLIWATVGILLGSIALAWMLRVASGIKGGEREFGTVEQAAALLRDAPLHLIAGVERDWQEPGVWSGVAPEEDPQSSGATYAGEPPGGIVLEWVRQHVLRRLNEAGLEHSFGDLLACYAVGRYGPATDRKALRSKLEQAGAARRLYAWEWAGDLALLDKDPAAAEACYRQELQLRNSRRAADWMLRHALHQAEDRNREPLRKAREDRRVWDAAHPALRLDAAAELRDGVAMAGAALEMDFLDASPGMLLVGLATAAVWFGIVAQFAGFGRGQWLLYGAAILLGMVSATAALVGSVVQEEILGTVVEREDLAGGLIHYVAGVGLREEALKLLFFLPLLPWLLRRGKAIDALAAAGLVGLGFALSENLGYFHLEGEGVAIGRLLTSNAFHVALTGCAGFALFRTLWFRGGGWDEALATFLAVVAAHGLYDSFIALPALAADLGIGSAIILALVSWRYFDLTASHFRPSGFRLPVLAVFVLGTALLVGLTLNVVIYGHPIFPGAFQYLLSTAQLLPTAFVYIHRFRGL